MSVKSMSAEEPAVAYDSAWVCKGPTRFLLQVDSVMAKKTAEGKALVPVTAAEFERLSGELMDMLDLEIL